ncbi:hypothetical protein OF83DRAFT_1174774 [Amylostereum chailletii]|nr:hypothetical protein OF83DRAFT_1174774 [Amylostereum chailletii]
MPQFKDEAYELDAAAVAGEETQGLIGNDSREIEWAPVEPVNAHLPLWLTICAYSSIFLFCVDVIFIFAFPSNAVCNWHSMCSRGTQQNLDKNTLYRPNFYIGLERLDPEVARAALPHEIQVFPHVFQPVSSKDPDRVYPYDGRSRRTFNGVVSPGEPHVHVDTQTSMIAQLRVQDQNMERCAIVANIPTLDELRSHNRTLHIARENMTIQVWDLNPSAGEIDVTQLSWRTRPKRERLVADLPIRQGEETRTNVFDCGPARTLRLFEFACGEGQSSDECGIEFWQEQPEVKPRMAFTIAQMPSI